MVRTGDCGPDRSSDYTLSIPLPLVRMSPDLSPAQNMYRTLRTHLQNMSHLLFLISTALGGFSGNLEHHLAAPGGSPGRPKEGLLLPQAGHLEHHLATDFGSPGRLKQGVVLLQRHFLFLISTALGGFSGHLEHHLAAP